MLQIYNTLSRKIEKFVPQDSRLVKVYCCGPTVYDWAHIGNFRTYTMSDLLVRTLKHLGHPVKYVMNITDVGHLVSDADEGEDKLEKGARREGKSASEIAKFYTEAFLTDSRKLNLLEPDVRPKPTEHIPEQIEMVKELLVKGFAYQIDDGIYFDTSKFASYGSLTGQSLDQLQAGARVEPNPEKRHAPDFALWKFSYPKGRSFDLAQDDVGKRRQMEWDSPWGVGFPGWHIECSAMSRKHLGEQLDLHTGGRDLIPIHHTNEIAQSEAVSGKSPFVKYWVHGQFIQVDGEKMAKSKGNFYRLDDLVAKDFDPLALRYLYLTAHYRAYLNFTWEGLKSAAHSLTQLRTHVSRFKSQKPERSALSEEKLIKIGNLRDKFQTAISTDLNTPQALAVIWETVKSSIPPGDKYDLLLEFDDVLGLKLDQVTEIIVSPDKIPTAVLELINKRAQFKLDKKFSAADVVRAQIEKLGYLVEDTTTGQNLRRKLL